MIDREELEPPQEIQWCPGCGNFGILRALKQAVMELGHPKHEFFLVSGIGQSGKIPHFINLNGFHTLHGRAIPVATGAHVANTDLKVIVHGGDGDLLGEGLGHLMHAARRNVNITCLLHNNGVYGLTKGQYSPTSPHGFVSKTSPPPTGVPMDPVNPIGVAIMGGATFVARGFAGDIQQLTQLIVDAVEHSGFALVEIMQPCVVFNPKWSWNFFRERVYKLEDTEYDSSDKSAALEKSFEFGDNIPTGVFYKHDKTHLAEELALPEGRLRDHTNNPENLQDIIDKMLV